MRLLQKAKKGVSMGQITGAIKHSVMRAISVFCVFAVIAGIGWCVYKVMIKKPDATTATSQKADAITNNYINPSTAEIVNAIKSNKEDAFQLKLIPPKIKIGGFKFTIFGD